MMATHDDGSSHRAGNAGQLGRRPWSISLAALVSHCGDGGQLAGVLHCEQRKLGLSRQTSTPQCSLRRPRRMGLQGRTGGPRAPVGRAARPSLAEASPAPSGRPARSRARSCWVRAQVQHRRNAAKRQEMQVHVWVHSSSHKEKKADPRGSAFFVIA